MIKEIDVFPYEFARDEKGNIIVMLRTREGEEVGVYYKVSDPQEVPPFWTKFKVTISDAS
jgi:hypothetical protein